MNVEHSKCLAIICNDPDAPGGGGFIHWLAWNIELVKLLPGKDPKRPRSYLPGKGRTGDKQFWEDRVLWSLPAPRPDAPVFLQSLRSGCRARSCTRCSKRGVFTSHGRACCPVRRDLRDLREITCKACPGSGSIHSRSTTESFIIPVRFPDCIGVDSPPFSLLP